MTQLHRFTRQCRLAFWMVLAWLAVLGGGSAHAQVIYGVGAIGTTGTLTVVVSTSLFTVSPVDGSAAPICTLAGPTSANSVSSVDGQVYYITRDGSVPARLYRINPFTCVNTFVGSISGAAASSLGDITLRATHCPDGRFYAASNTSQFFEIDSSTGATLRTLNWTGLPTGGSGDFACTSSGDMYLVAPTTTDGTTYALYRASAASFASVLSGSNVPTSLIGSSLGLGGTPTGIAEGPMGTGCAASPNPCLLVSTGGTYQTWRANSVTGVATNAGATGHGLADLARSFPVDLSFSKAVTPTMVLQGQTVAYTLTVSNLGPGVASLISVQDIFPAGIASASWACTVQSPGSATLVSTSCGDTSSGSGNINTLISLSAGASVRYAVTASLSSSFSGTLTNSGGATLTTPATDPVPSNNSASATATVTPAANLTLTKSNGMTTLTAGAITSYTLTVANLGPGDGSGATLADPVATGLVCSSVTCSVGSGAASCPVAPALTTTNLQNSGVVIPGLPANSSLNFVVTCSVTATGVP